MNGTSLRERQRALTRDALIEAGERLFEVKGYLEATVDDIVREAGTSRPTFYAYFDSKAQLLEAIVAKLTAHDNYVSLQNSFRELDEPSIDALQGWFEKYVDFYKSNIPIHKAVHEARAVDRLFQAAMLDNLQTHVDLWASVGFVGDPNDEDLRLSALMLYALGDQFMYMWLVHGLDIDRSKATRALASALFSTLRSSQMPK